MMPWEDVDINNDEPESIDDAASGFPDGWEKMHVSLRTYKKSYEIGLDVEIFVLEDYDAGKYTINPSVKDADTGKKLSEKTYYTDDKDSIEQFVMRLIHMYDDTFEKKE